MHAGIVAGDHADSMAASSRQNHLLHATSSGRAQPGGVMETSRMEAALTDIQEAKQVPLDLYKV